MDRAAREDLDRCLARLQDGDRDAFEPVFARVFPLLRRFAAAACKNGADAEDVAQAALLRVYSQAHRYDRKRDGLAWIAGIAAYEIKSHRKRVERRRESEVVLENVPAPGAMEEDMIAQQLIASVREVLGTLSAQDEEAILAAAELCPRPAIAAATFRKRLERALMRLRHAWREKHGVE
jgi:RNA polymerase sigma-70 factor (ECF subfamily)